MMRIITSLVVGLTVLNWQASALADTSAQAALGNDAIASIGALRAQHERLRKQLRRHRVLAEAGGWPAVPDGPTIRPDSDDPRLALLARRLAVSGDLAEGEASSVIVNYGEALQAAVRRFQVRHGLAGDGLVGPATLQALNVTVDSRIDQLRVNLERARLLPDNLGDRLILVNSAAYKAYLLRGGETVWSTRVIVGTAEYETPELRSEVQRVVINPSWSVPHSIAIREMLPTIRNDPAFFRKGGYELYDREGNMVDPGAVDWAAVSSRNFRFTLLQRPGPANQLGQIKFVFPNDYSVCMHDTPGKSLFENAARAYSHGCIRVERPRTLAGFLLDSEGWTRQQIDQQIRSGATRTVVLSRPMPLVVLYWTAEVDSSGRVYFFKDIYGRDARALRRLESETPAVLERRPGAFR